MFGGHGLYRDGVFFGIVYKGRLYFRVTDDSVPAYRKFGMKSFRPNATQTLKAYYEVPVDVVEDAERLTAWAVQALRSRARPSSPPGPVKSGRLLRATKKGPTKPVRS